MQPAGNVETPAITKIEVADKVVCLYGNNKTSDLCL